MAWKPFRVKEQGVQMSASHEVAQENQSFWGFLQGISSALSWWLVAELV